MFVLYCVIMRLGLEMMNSGELIMGMDRWFCRIGGSDMVVFVGIVME